MRKATIGRGDNSTHHEHETAQGREQSKRVNNELILAHLSVHVVRKEKRGQGRHVENHVLKWKERKQGRNILMVMDCGGREASARTTHHKEEQPEPQGGADVSSDTVVAGQTAIKDAPQEAQPQNGSNGIQGSGAVAVVGTHKGAQTRLWVCQERRALLRVL